VKADRNDVCSPRNAGCGGCCVPRQQIWVCEITYLPFVLSPSMPNFLIIGLFQIFLLNKVLFKKIDFLKKLRMWVGFYLLKN